MLRPFNLTVLIVSVSMSTQALGAVIYVNDTATHGANNGTNWQDAYLDLQTALAQAQPGDRVHIAQGFYMPAPPNGPREATFNIPNGVIVQGGYSGYGGSEASLPHPEAFYSFLTGDLNGNDGPGDFVDYNENSYHVVTADGVGAGTELRGVRIVAGNATSNNFQTNDGYGGGLLCLNSMILVQGCTIEDNQASVGGGVHARVFEAASIITMEGCTIQRNRCTYTFGSGGGVICGAGSTFNNCIFTENAALPVASAGALEAFGSTIKNCSFIDNSGSEDGGAIYGSNLSIENCEFINNGSGVFGGAITVRTSFIDNCFFRENSSNSGGAILALGAGTSILRSRFINNVAAVGGAVNGDVKIVNCEFLSNYIYPHGSGGGAAFQGSGEVVNCLFSGNWTIDYGVISGGPFELTNCTIVGNEAKGDPDTPSGAIHNYSGATQLRNCILWDNIGAAGNQQDKQIFVQNGSVTINNSIIQGWDGTYGGVGNSGADPQFADADGSDDVYGTEDDDAGLSKSSPARDAGNNSWLPNDEFDLDNDGNTAESIPFDLDEQARIVNSIVDLGAYEFQGTACVADIAPQQADGQVNVDDLLALISAWGSCSSSECPFDIDNNGEVDVDDLLAVIGAWGPCD